MEANTCLTPTHLLNHQVFQNEKTNEIENLFLISLSLSIDCRCVISFPCVNFSALGLDFWTKKKWKKIKQSNNGRSKAMEDCVQLIRSNENYGAEISFCWWFSNLKTDPKLWQSLRVVLFFYSLLLLPQEAHG